MNPLLFLAIVVLPSHDVVFHADRSSFESHVPGLANREDFESSTASFSATHRSLSACTDDGVFRPGDIEGGLVVEIPVAVPNALTSRIGGSPGQPSVVVGPTEAGEDLQLSFTNAPFAVGFDLFTDHSVTVLVRIHDLDSELLGHTTIDAGPDAASFVGIEAALDGPAIGSVRLELPAASRGAIDDVVFSGHADPVLFADHGSVRPGQALRLGITETEPGSRGVILLRCVGDRPLSALLWSGPIEGTLCLPPAIVPELPSLSVALHGFVLEPTTGRLKATNLLELRIE